MRHLSIVIPIVLFLIFIMLISALRSFRSAALIMVNLPLAVVGGTAATYFLGIHLSVAATISFIAVLVVAVEDALVQISFCDQHRARDMQVLDAVHETCRLRIRPLIMTTMTTLLRLLPTFYATGSGSEIQQPLVAVIFGGMLSSLIIELIVLPLLYVLVNRDRTAISAEVIYSN